MELYVILSIIAFFLMLGVGFFFGKKSVKENPESAIREETLRSRIEELNADLTRQQEKYDRLTEANSSLISQRDVLQSQLAQVEKDLANKQSEYSESIAGLKEDNVKRQKELKEDYEERLKELREAHNRLVNDIKENHHKQIADLKELNNKEIESRLNLMREQIQTTSEEMLKRRQEELGERNNEQVGKIVDPLLKSLKEMQTAFENNKEQQQKAMTELNKTISINTERSQELGVTADRLARALTGEVKVQGNFGELKLRQLLEDLDLHEGEQYDSQQTLRDKFGKTVKGDDGVAFVPDFILHFPNNRHVVVDSKMSLTAFERYMNAESEEERSSELHAHLDSVRAQVKRLARKDYSRYLPSGYNRLDFAFMYVPVDSALNLAMLNDNGLWREAYDMGVIILGPQTMYMNLRVLEMMWTQVRQLENQEAMIEAANRIIERVQDFGKRLKDVEDSAMKTVDNIAQLKKSTSEKGQSIFVAAKSLIKAGGKENRKKKSVSEYEELIMSDDSDSRFLDEDSTLMLER